MLEDVARGRHKHLSDKICRVPARRGHRQPTYTMSNQIRLDSPRLPSDELGHASTSTCSLLQLRESESWRLVLDKLVAFLHKCARKRYAFQDYWCAALSDY